MREQIKTAVSNITDTFTGADGGAKFVAFKAAIEEMDRQASAGDAGDDGEAGGGGGWGRKSGRDFKTGHSSLSQTPTRSWKHGFTSARLSKSLRRRHGQSTHRERCVGLSRPPMSHLSVRPPELAVLRKSLATVAGRLRRDERLTREPCCSNQMHAADLSS